MLSVKYGATTTTVATKISTILLLSVVCTYVLTLMYI
jgi:hypothetical protein